jgi:hypothetical protein
VLDQNICAFANPLPPAAFGDSTLAELMTKYGFRTEGRDVAAPACKAQGAYPGFGTEFPQVKAAP